jgi:hypothetical protein
MPLLAASEGAPSGIAGATFGLLSALALLTVGAVVASGRRGGVEAAGEALLATEYTLEMTGRIESAP